MPLTRPARRELIHSRDIRCRGYRREDGHWDIEGELVDTKTYSFANRDREGIAAGEAIHHMRIRLTLDEGMRVRDCEATTEAGPFDLCPAITPAFAALAGLQVGPGWRRAILQRMGGVAGCTHLTELLLGPVTTTALQTIGPARNRRQQPQEGGGPPPILDRCHALARGSDVVRRHWPEFWESS